MSELRDKVADAVSGLTIWEGAAAIGSEDSWPVADAAIAVVLAEVERKIEELQAAEEGMRTPEVRPSDQAFLGGMWKASELVRAMRVTESSVTDETSEASSLREGGNDGTAPIDA